jgi:curved DNA-binding protein CbpA
VTYEEALRILELTEGYTLDDLKAAFRRAAKKYHPDVSGTTETAQRFIEANAAYQLLLEALQTVARARTGAGDARGASGEAQEVEDPLLEERIRLLKRAFEKIVRDTETRYEAMQQRVVDRIHRNLTSYGNKNNLEKRFESDTRTLIEDELNQLIGSLTRALQDLIDRYDEWLNATLNFAFKRRRQQEMSEAMRSPKQVVNAVLCSSVVGILLWWAGAAPFPTSLFGLCALGLPYVVAATRIAYRWRSDRFRLDVSAREVLPERGMFAPNVSHVWSKEEAGGAGLVGGGIVGFAFGGFIGALVGAAIGGLIGSLFGEPYERTAERVWDQVRPALIQYFDKLGEYLDRQLWEAQERLIERIRANYTEAKRQAILALLPPKSQR